MRATTTTCRRISLTCRRRSRHLMMDVSRRRSMGVRCRLGIPIGRLCIRGGRWRSWWRRMRSSLRIGTQVMIRGWICCADRRSIVSFNGVGAGRWNQPWTDVIFPLARFVHSLIHVCVSIHHGPRSGLFFLSLLSLSFNVAYSTKIYHAICIAHSLNLSPNPNHVYCVTLHLSLPRSLSRPSHNFILFVFLCLLARSLPLTSLVFIVPCFCFLF